jgi:hypothetical protein
MPPPPMAPLIVAKNARAALEHGCVKRHYQANN